MHLLTKRTLAISFGSLLVGLTLSAEPEAASNVTIPITCTKGPSGQSFEVAPRIPTATNEGGVVNVRVDGVRSGKVSHFGLNYIRDITFEYLVPDGASLVAGSAHVVPGTGSENVRKDARVSVAGRSIRLVLPAHVESGEYYTPPSLEWQLDVKSSAGDAITHRFGQFLVTANAVVVGDVPTVCTPNPSPYAIGKTSVVARAEP